jgi:molybdenum cofactor synthesis domain-containing protein
VHVTRRPRIGILATGDEVVEVDAPLAPGKIRNTNSYANAAQVLRAGGTPVMMGIARDDVQELTAKIRAGLAQGVDLFITSGGVSVGDFDVVKKVLAAEGEITFWRVRMKPGKPLAFGRIQGVPMLGLPGNPVSAMVSFELFARPAILYMQGLANLGRPTVEARLMDEVRRKDDRRHYLRVRVEQRGSEYLAYLTGEQGSGILSSMVEADGLAILPEEWSSAKQGSRVRVWMLDWERGPHMQAEAPLRGNYEPRFSSRPTDGLNTIEGAAPLRGNYEPRKGSAMILSLGILTISDRCSRGEAEDASGPAIRRIAMERLGAEVKAEACVPDEVNRISSLLVEWCDTRQLDLILTTGGTGFSPRDVTPEAMLAVIQRQAPGLGEAMRREGAKATPHAMLSRATAGMRGKTLIVNLPGSVKAVTEGLEVILPALPHAIEILTGAQGANQRHEFKH